MSHECTYKANPSWYGIRCCIYCDKVDPTEPIAERLKEEVMSDKGDIDVGLALHLTRCISNKHDDIRHDIGLIIMQELRAHGWLHEDDVVEGRTAKADRCFHYDKWMENVGICSLDNPECLEHTDHCHKTRPATVKDLIG